MLSRGQHTLYRGVLAALQQHQQQCLQLEVLGLQASREYQNDYRMAQQLPRGVKDKLRTNAAVERVLAQTRPRLPPADASSSSDATAASAADGTSQAAGAASSTAAAAAKKSQSASWAPAWLDRIMDLPRRRRSHGTSSPLQSGPAAAAPAGASPLQESAPAPRAVTQEEENDALEGDWAWLDKSANLSLDDYNTSIENEPETSSSGIDRTPRPQRPSYRGPNATYKARMDWQRVNHIRYAQQSSLIEMMSENDKAAIKADAAAVLKDTAALERIARIGHTTVVIVKDTIRSYKNQRDFYDLLREYRDAGHAMPPAGDHNATHDLYLKLQEKKKKKELMAVLKKRDPENCQLKAWAKLVGKNRTCPRTQLPFVMCCGAIKSGRRH